MEAEGGWQGGKGPGKERCSPTITSADLLRPLASRQPKKGAAEGDAPPGWSFLFFIQAPAKRGSPPGWTQGVLHQESPEDLREDLASLWPPDWSVLSSMSPGTRANDPEEQNIGASREIRRSWTTRELVEFDTSH
ncbi:hypothetical protein KM043_003613 [Ampulex compressa]|nr:hypothetical protein KM043_003613 [Ampulex compressa]